MYLLLNACLCIMNHCNKCTKVQEQLLFLSSSDRNCTYVSNFLGSRDLIHIKLSNNHSEWGEGGGGEYIGKEKRMK